MNYDSAFTLKDDSACQSHNSWNNRCVNDLGRKRVYWTRNICMQLSTLNIYQHVMYSFIFNTRLYVICGPSTWKLHNSDVIVSAMASQITGFPIVCLTVCSGADQRKHRSSASLTIWWRHHVDKPIGKSLSIIICNLSLIFNNDMKSISSLCQYPIDEFNRSRRKLQIHNCARMATWSLLQVSYNRC